MELRSAVLSQALHMAMGPIPTGGFGLAPFSARSNDWAPELVTRSVFLAPELATRTGHQGCVLAPELVTTTVFWPPKRPPQRRFGTQRGHQYGVSAPEAVTRTVVRRLSWRGKGVLKCGMAESS